MTAIIWGIVLGFLFLMLTWSTLRCMLSPMVSATRDSRLPTQFSIADFFCLVLLLQVWMAAVYLFFRGIDQDKFASVCCDAVGGAIFTMLWWTGVRTLSRAGVRTPWHRCAFLAFVVPSSFAVAIATPFWLTWLALFSITNLFREPPRPMGPPGQMDSTLLVWVWTVGGTLGLLGFVYGINRFTRWVVARAQPPCSAPGNVGNPFGGGASAIEAAPTLDQCQAAIQAEDRL